jgi:DNA repair protein RecN (Recombination protein N)
MLVTLSIKNYAIIQELSVDFAPGFSVITGETGAGKSIIMGALSLILGQRADSSVLFDKELKCVIEGKFQLSPSEELTAFFEENDLDLENIILLRREITNAGKSRAFVNDTPVQLTLLRELGLKLIDIHSQHSNLDLGKRLFQLNVVDWFSDHKQLLDSYFETYKSWRNLELQYNLLKDKALQANTDLDYYHFQFKQLEEVKLVECEQAVLEQDQELLTHSEEIKSGLNQVFQLLDAAEINVIGSVKESITVIQRLVNYLPQAKSIIERLDSQLIELRDIAGECELLAEKTEHDPEKLALITDRLNTIYSLQQKHRVDSVEALIQLRNDFDTKIQTAASYDDELIKLEKLIQQEKEKLQKAADKLHHSRLAQLPKIEKEISLIVKQLGMQNAQFKVEIERRSDFTPNGNDDVFFLFNANKGGQLDEINRVASGGELSRLMLAIKTVVAKSKALPAIVFDEIDTGISGEIALKMGEILKDMANYMQVINITHLPQIAAKGSQHYFVFKNEASDRTVSGMRLLNHEERITEIAKMLSGDNPTPAAVENARSLLGFDR